MGILKSYHRNHVQELIRLHQTWKGCNSLSWVTQRVGHLALRWRWPQQSITWPSSACVKGWTGRELLTVPEASGLALVPAVSMACPPVHLCTCAPPRTTAHPSTWTQTCRSLHLVPEPGSRVCVCVYVCSDSFILTSSTMSAT